MKRWICASAALLVCSCSQPAKVADSGKGLQPKQVSKRVPAPVLVPSTPAQQPAVPGTVAAPDSAEGFIALLDRANKAMLETNGDLGVDISSAMQKFSMIHDEDNLRRDMDKARASYLQKLNAIDSALQQIPRLPDASATLDDFRIIMQDAIDGLDASIRVIEADAEASAQVAELRKIRDSRAKLIAQHCDAFNSDFGQFCRHHGQAVPFTETPDALQDDQNAPN